MDNGLKILTILGHTAAGKTKLAANVASALNGEVISADSRQVYRGMDIGTGKDYEDYIVNEKEVKYHLVDIVEAGREYNVFEFQKDFKEVAEKITLDHKLPVLCGGTGMYIESVLRGYRMTRVPVNQALRSKLEGKSIEELALLLRKYKQPHNQTDTQNKKRAVRAIEIAEYMSANTDSEMEIQNIQSVTVGVRYDREERRKRITERLKQRLQEGMVEEVEGLVEKGVSFDKLEYYGLEYKYLAQYISGKVSYNEMFTKLNTAIHQFAKRQMTYFRGMERRGVDIKWIDGEIKFKEKVQSILNDWTARNIR